MEENRERRRSRTDLVLGLVLLASVVSAAFLLLRKWRRRSIEEQPSELLPERRQPPGILDLRGLDEAEATRRRLEGQDNAILFKPPYSKREILRANTVNILNLILVALAMVQMLLGRPWDAVLTVIVLAFGIGLNIGQQLWARGRLKKLEQATRPQATVLRQGTIRSIDPGEVVQGDILVAGPGDPILADGQVLRQGDIVVDESMLTGDPGQYNRQAGKMVYAGSFCVRGHGAYEAQKVGDQRLIASLTGGFENVRESLTPLERTMKRLLYLLLVAVGLFSILLLVDYYTRLFPVLHTDAAINAANVIFGLAPASLFFMIMVNYAMGTYDVLKVGALVHRYRSVESLAQATVVCLAQAGILTGVGVEMEPVQAPGTQPLPAKARIRQILGMYAHNSSGSSPVLKAMTEAYPGSPRPKREEASYLSAFGWSAISFADGDMRGVYVLGEPEVLKPRLASDDGELSGAGSEEETPHDWQERLVAWGRNLWSREDAILLNGGTGATLNGGAKAGTTVAYHAATSEPGFLRRLSTRVRETLQPSTTRHKAGKAVPEGSAQGPAQAIVYTMAYHSELVPLHDSEGAPRLPDTLVPLCQLRYTEQVRPEAIETLKSFARVGVGIKVFSTGAPKQAAAILGQAGLMAEDGGTAPSISGPELAAMDGQELARAATENAVFGHMPAEQVSQVVGALGRCGEVVAFLGDAVNDLAAMQQAHLSIARQSSSPAALSVADIVLLQNSSQALLGVLEKGQRIANGVLDVLRLYLNQIVYLMILILAVWGAGLGFPYLSKQGSLITVVSVILPSLGLTFWAPSGVIPRNSLGWLLARCVVPAAVSISAAAFVVSRLFLEMTKDATYTQLITTYMLVISGLVLVILLRPPIRPRAGGDPRSGDWRPTAMVVVLLVLLFMVASIPLANSLFGLQPLRQPQDYLVVGLAVVAWASVTSLLWRIAPLERILPALRSR